MTLTIDARGDNCWDITHDETHEDAHLSYDPHLKRWCLDIFDKRIKNADEAHLETIELNCKAGNEPDWTEVIREVTNRKESLCPSSP